jgi:hypothetical protein
MNFDEMFEKFEHLKKDDVEEFRKAKEEGYITDMKIPEPLQFFQYLSAKSMIEENGGNWQDIQKQIVEMSAQMQSQLSAYHRGVLDFLLKDTKKKNSYFNPRNN